MILAGGGGTEGRVGRGGLKASATLLLLFGTKQKTKEQRRLLLLLMAKTLRLWPTEIDFHWCQKFSISENVSTERKSC